VGAGKVEIKKRGEKEVNIVSVEEALEIMK
jgi:hypothetical protein